MAIKRANISGLDNLATWLNANCAGLFGSVTYSSSKLTATDKDSHTILEITAASCKAYRAASSYIESNMASSGFGTTDVIACDNGVILKTSYTYNISRSFGVLIAKTNNDNRLAVIFSAGGTDSTDANYAYTALKHVAWGDSTSITPTTTTFAPEAGQQTILCPWGTNPDTGQTSYTPKAFYLPTGQNYSQGIGKFILGADTYITNGYWAIKDGGAT